MKNYNLDEIIKHWNYIASIIRSPKNDKQLDDLIQILDALLDKVGNDENHVLMCLVEIISNLIEKYESSRYRKEKEAPSGIDALKFLMQAHDLKQSDLPEIGSQGVVSEILSGKRLLNVKQIEKLSKRFRISPATFFSEKFNSFSSISNIRSSRKIASR